MAAQTSPNPVSGLLHSRKFLLLVLDTIVALATYFIGKYAGADSHDLLVLIGALQPIFVLAVTAITVEDTARTQADAKVQAAGVMAQTLTTSELAPARKTNGDLRNLVNVDAKGP